MHSSSTSGGVYLVNPPWNFVFYVVYPNISAMREIRERWSSDKGRIHDTDTETDTQRDKEKDRGKDRERDWRLRRRLINTCTCTCTLKLLPCTYNYSRAITSLHKGGRGPEQTIKKMTLIRNPVSRVPVFLCSL